MNVETVIEAEAAMNKLLKEMRDAGTPIVWRRRIEEIIALIETWRLK